MAGIPTRRIDAAALHLKSHVGALGIESVADILIPIGATMTAFPIFYAVIENDLRLALSRKGTRWDLALFVLVAYRLIAPGSEWRLHREWGIPQLMQRLQKRANLAHWKPHAIGRHPAPERAAVPTGTAERLVLPAVPSAPGTLNSRGARPPSKRPRVKVV